MIISLTGFMGCGKSRVGKSLAMMLHCPFVDLDAFIEEREGRKIPDIFGTDGETGFRRIEKLALGKIVEAGHPDMPGAENLLILSLGGGTLTTPQCAGLVKDRTVCIYLKASVETLVHNLENDFEGRPMLNPAGADTGKLRARIEQLMKQREQTYEDTARYIIDTDGKESDEVASEVAGLLKGAVSQHGNPTAVRRQKTVRDPLRKKEVSLTPEEAVRQWCINELLHGQMKIPMHMMMSETGFRLGDKQFRADILVYDRQARPLAVVECKRPEVRLDRNVLEQAIRYNMVLSVKYIIITNGTRTVIFRKGPEGYRAEQTAPQYEEMLK